MPSLISSVGGAEDLGIQGRWFDLGFGQYSLPGIMIVTAIIIVTSLTVVHCSDDGYGKAASGLKTILCEVHAIDAAI